MAVPLDGANFWLLEFADCWLAWVEFVTGCTGWFLDVAILLDLSQGLCLGCCSSAALTAAAAANRAIRVKASVNERVNFDQL